MLHVRGNRDWIHAGANNQVHEPAAVAALQEWFIHRRLLTLAEGAVAAVANDADDFGGICLPLRPWQQNLAAHRVDACQIARRELVVDDHDGRRSRSIVGW